MPTPSRRAFFMSHMVDKTHKCFQHHLRCYTTVSRCCGLGAVLLRPRDNWCLVGLRVEVYRPGHVMRLVCRGVQYNQPAIKGRMRGKPVASPRSPKRDKCRRRMGDNAMAAPLMMYYLYTHQMRKKRNTRRRNLLCEPRLPLIQKLIYSIAYYLDSRPRSYCRERLVEPWEVDK